MHKSYLSNLDKNWLREIIDDKNEHFSNISGALASEVISDAVVLGSGVLTVAFAVASKSLIPLAANPMPMVQLGLAYKTIRSLMDQRTKVQNDLHVLNAILTIDEETDENITAMVHDFIEIHSDPDNEGHPSHLEVKQLSPEALRTIQRNFRQKKEKHSFGQKAVLSAGFLCNEFGNAAKMVGKTLLNPIALGRSILSSARNISRTIGDWNDIKESATAETLRESYNRMLRRARKASVGDDVLPKRVGDMFLKERKEQLYYLHQQQTSLREVSKLRLDTVAGYGACAGIIGIACYSGISATTIAGALGAVYTVVASLPSLKVLGGELEVLTKTSEKYAPKVDKAAAEFIMGMPSRAV